MEDPKRYKRKKKNRRHTAAIIFILVIIIAGLLLAGAIVFCKVSEVSVTGDTRYSYEEIVDCSDVQYGQSSLLLPKKKIADAVLSECTYLEKVLIIQHLPDRVELMVTEYEKLYNCVNPEGVVTTINGNGKVVSQNTLFIDVDPLVYGKDYSSLSVGDVVPDTVFLEELNLIRETLEKADMWERTSYIHFVDFYDWRVQYTDSVEMRLGTANSLEEKLNSAKLVISQGLKSTFIGYLDVSIDKKVYAKECPLDELLMPHYYKINYGLSELPPEDLTPTDITASSPSDITS